MTNKEQRLETTTSILKSLILRGNMTSNDEQIENIVKLSIKISDKLIEELSITNIEKEKIEDSDNIYSFANTEVDRIMSLSYDGTTNLFQELQYSGLKYDKQIKLEYYQHLSTLFLNVILNRLSFYLDPKTAEDRAFTARQGITVIIEDIRKNL